jgi:hypothetical protein
MDRRQSDSSSSDKDLGSQAASRFKSFSDASGGAGAVGARDLNGTRSRSDLG